MKILSLVLLIVAIILGIYAIKAIKESGEYSYCGTIKFKVDATRYSKYSAHADPIFVVDFPAQRGEKAFIKEIHPSWNTYLSYREGNGICFVLTHPDRPNLAEGPFLLILCVFVGFAAWVLQIDIKWIKR